MRVRVWRAPQGIGDLFLRTRRNGLIELELREWDLLRVTAVILRGTFGVL